jgi:hypothetical protein
LLVDGVDATTGATLFDHIWLATSGPASARRYRMVGRQGLRLCDTRCRLSRQGGW